MLPLPCFVWSMHVGKPTIRPTDRKCTYHVSRLIFDYLTRLELALFFADSPRFCTPSLGKQARLCECEYVQYFLFESVDESKR